MAKKGPESGSVFNATEYAKSAGRVGDGIIDELIQKGVDPNAMPEVTEAVGKAVRKINELAETHRDAKPATRKSLVNQMKGIRKELSVDLTARARQAAEEYLETHPKAPPQPEVAAAPAVAEAAPAPATVEVTPPATPTPAPAEAAAPAPVPAEADEPKPAEAAPAPAPAPVEVAVPTVGPEVPQPITPEPVVAAEPAPAEAAAPVSAVVPPKVEKPVEPEKTESPEAEAPKTAFAAAFAKPGALKGKAKEVKPSDVEKARAAAVRKGEVVVTQESIDKDKDEMSRLAQEVGGRKGEASTYGDGKTEKKEVPDELKAIFNDREVPKKVADMYARLRKPETRKSYLETVAKDEAEKSQRKEAREKAKKAREEKRAEAQTAAPEAKARHERKERKGPRNVYELRLTDLENALKERYPEGMPPEVLEKYNALTKAQLENISHRNAAEMKKTSAEVEAFIAETSPSAAGETVAAEEVVEEGVDTRGHKAPQYGQKGLERARSQMQKEMNALEESKPAQEAAATRPVFADENLRADVQTRVTLGKDLGYGLGDISNMSHGEAQEIIRQGRKFGEEKRAPAVRPEVGDLNLKIQKALKTFDELTEKGLPTYGGEIKELARDSGIEITNEDNYKSIADKLRARLVATPSQPAAAAAEVEPQTLQAQEQKTERERAPEATPAAMPPGEFEKLWAQEPLNYWSVDSTGKSINLQNKSEMESVVPLPTAADELTPKGWRDKLRGLVGKITEGAKEKLGMSPRGEKLATNLTERTKELDAQAAKMGWIEKGFRKMGETYNKMPLRYKVATGILLGAGSVVTAGVSIAAPLAFMSGIAAQRVAGMAGMFLNLEKKLQDKAEKTGGLQFKIEKGDDLIEGSKPLEYVVPFPVSGAQKIERGAWQKALSSKEMAMLKAALWSIGLGYAVKEGVEWASDTEAGHAVQRWLGDMLGHHTAPPTEASPNAVPGAAAAATAETATPAAAAEVAAAAPEVPHGPATELPVTTAYSPEASTPEAPAPEIPDMSMRVEPHPDFPHEVTRVDSGDMGDVLEIHEPGEAEAEAPVPGAEEASVTPEEGAAPPPEAEAGGPAGVGTPEEPAPLIQEPAPVVEKSIAANPFGLVVPVAETHIYADAGDTHTFVFGGSPHEQAEAIHKFLVENPNKVIYGTDSTGTYRVPWHLVDGKEVVAGPPMKTGGLFGIGSTFMKPPGAAEFEKLIK